MPVVSRAKLTVAALLVVLLRSKVTPLTTSFTVLLLRVTVRPSTFMMASVAACEAASALLMIKGAMPELLAILSENAPAEPVAPVSTI